jgi:hypothetical protein
MPHHRRTHERMPRLPFLTILPRRIEAVDAAPVVLDLLQLFRYKALSVVLGA